MLLRIPPGLNLKSFNVLAAQCICVLCVVLRRNTEFLPTQHLVPALTDAGPSESLWEKKNPTFWYINVSLDEKLKWSIMYRFYIILIKQSVKCIIYLIKKGKPNIITFFLLFVQGNLPWSQNLNITSVRELCVVSHCIVFEITNARIPHDRGDHVNAEPDCIKSVQ
jgi:hypothetical protein